MEDKTKDTKLPVLRCDYDFCYVCGSAMAKTNIEGIGEWWKCPECGALDEIVCPPKTGN